MTFLYILYDDEINLPTYLLHFCLLYFLSLSEKFLSILSSLSPSLHRNFISAFGHYLYVNHSQHDFHKPLSQVLPQNTSLKSLPEIHFQAVLEGLPFKIFFDSFLGKFFIIAETVPPLQFWPSCGPEISCDA